MRLRGWHNRTRRALTAERLAIRDNWTTCGLTTARSTGSTRIHADLREEVRRVSRASITGWRGRPARARRAHRAVGIPPSVRVEHVAVGRSHRRKGRKHEAFLHRPRCRSHSLSLEPSSPPPKASTRLFVIPAGLFDSHAHEVAFPNSASISALQVRTPVRGESPPAFRSRERRVGIFLVDVEMRLSAAESLLCVLRSGECYHTRLD